jgi:uncharacterized protein YbjQ (UPF0145 family)
MESLKSMVSSLLVIIPFVLIFSLVFKEIRRQKKKWAVLHEINRLLEKLKQDILVVPTPTVPDKKIEQELGEISAESAVSGRSYRVAEKKALIALMLKAKEKGANAIVELHWERAPYDATRKIQWQAETIRLAGKAVKIGDITSGNNKNLANNPDT